MYLSRALLLPVSFSNSSLKWSAVHCHSAGVSFMKEHLLFTPLIFTRYYLYTRLSEHSEDVFLVRLTRVNWFKSWRLLLI